MEYRNWIGCGISPVRRLAVRACAIPGPATEPRLAAACRKSTRPGATRRKPRRRFNPLTPLLGCLLLSTASLAWAQQSRVDWRTGTDLQKRLAAPIGVHWTGKPTRAALSSLSRTQRVAAMLDRRVDPDRPLDATYTDATLEAIFHDLAKYLEAKYVQFGPVALLGPVEGVSRIRTLALLRREEARRLPAAAARRYLKAQRSAWDDLAEPRELVRLLAQEGRFEAHGLERIPHDLWPAADLPSLSLLDRLTLILNQFDLTFEISADGSAITLTSIPAEVWLVRDYAGGPRAEQTAARWAQLIPQAQVKVVGQTVYVKGLLEEHERITRPDRGAHGSPAASTASTASTAEDRSQFTIDDARATLGDIIASLSPQLKAQIGVELRVDRAAIRAAGVSLDQQVSVSIRNATLDELLEAILKDTGCTHRRLGSIVEIIPAPPN